MSNVIEYIINLQDKFSAKIYKISESGNKITNSFAAATKSTNTAKFGFDTLGNSAEALRAKIQYLRDQKEILPVRELKTIRQYNSEISKLEGQLGKIETLNGGWFKTKMSEVFGSIPSFLTNPIVGIGAAIGASIHSGMENELQRSNISTLLGGDEIKTDALFKNISEYAKNTTYGKKDIVDAQKTMMSFGLSSDFAFDKIKQIGDIALGDANKMQSLSLAFSQATSTGKLMGQDLLQMINAGFNPLEVISQRTGRSIKELKEDMSKGAISTKMLSKAFEWATDEQGRFYQGAEKAGETITGKIGKMKDSLTELSLTIYSAIDPIIKPIVDLATTVFETVGNGFTWLIEKVKEGNPLILGIASFIGVLTAALVVYNTITTITKAIQNGLTLAIWKSNFAFLASPVFWIIAGVVALIAVIVFLAVKIKGWGTLWDATINFCKNVIMMFVETVKLYFMSLVNAVALPLDLIKKKWYEFKNAVGLGDEQENNAAIKAINNDIDSRIDKMAQSSKNIKKYAQAAKDSFKGVKLEVDNKTTIKSVADDLKKKLGITDNSAVTNNDFSNDMTTKSETISSGGKSVKNFNITINDGLVNGVQNYFNDSKEDPASATDFMTKLSNALQMVLNDVNYAAQ